MRKLLPLLAILLVAAATSPATAASDMALQEANRAYKETRYQAAYDGYLQILRTEGESGHLFYNLGNAAFRLGRLGQAILFYEKARLTLPRDADLAYNLGHARGQVRDAIPEQEDFLDAAFFWLGSVALSEMFWLFVAVNALFWTSLAFRVLSRAEWLYSLFYLVLAAWLLAGASLGLKWHQTAADDRAVVLPAEVNVLAGPDGRDTVLFKLHEGTIVRVERTEDGWSLIRLPDGKRGWMRGEAAGRIAAAPS